VQSGPGTGFSSDTSPFSAVSFHQCFVVIHRAGGRQWVPERRRLRSARDLFVTHRLCIKVVNTRRHISAAGINANGAGKRRSPREARVRELGAVCCRLRLSAGGDLSDGVQT
jgi:hypothetical protein